LGDTTIGAQFGVGKQFVSQIVSGHRRVGIATEFGPLVDNPSCIVYVWPYLSTSERP